MVCLVENDAADVARLVEEHQSLVYRVLGRVLRDHHSSRVGVEELMSAGLVALWMAARRYRPGGPARFTTFAWTRIHGAMITRINELVYWRNHGPSSHVQFVEIAELPEPIQESLSAPPAPLASDPFLARRIDAAISRLSERQQKVLRGLYYDERPLEEIARNCGCGKPSVCRIHATALQHLRRDPVIRRLVSPRTCEQWRSGRGGRGRLARAITTAMSGRDYVKVRQVIRLLQEQGLSVQGKTPLNVRVYNEIKIMERSGFVEREREGNGRYRLRGRGDDR